MRFLLLAAVVLSPPALVINKCIVQGKTVYQEAECPRGAVQKPIAERLQEGGPGADKAGADKAGTAKPGADKAGADKAGTAKTGADKAGVAKAGTAKASTSGPLPKLPELQRGRWTIEDSGGSVRALSTCGHPLFSLYAEYDQLVKLRGQGCTVNASSPRAGTVQVSTECPANLRNGEAKANNFTLVSPNPAYVSVQYTLKGQQQTISAKRSGDC